MSSTAAEPALLAHEQRFAPQRCGDEAALARLVELGELQPRATMLIAQKTHLTAVLPESHEIDVSLVEQGYLAALQGERVNHEQTVERIRQAHRLGLEVARRIARAEPVYPGTFARRCSARTRGTAGCGDHREPREGRVAVHGPAPPPLPPGSRAPRCAVAGA